VLLTNSLSTLATKVAENGDKLSPETENGNKSRCFRQHLLPFMATICLRFGQLLSPVWTRYNGAKRLNIGLSQRFSVSVIYYSAEQ